LIRPTKTYPLIPCTEVFGYRRDSDKLALSVHIYIYICVRMFFHEQVYLYLYTVVLNIETTQKLKTSSFGEMQLFNFILHNLEFLSKLLWLYCYYWWAKLYKFTYVYVCIYIFSEPLITCCCAASWAREAFGASTATKRK